MAPSSSHRVKRSKYLHRFDIQQKVELERQGETYEVRRQGHENKGEELIFGNY